MKLSLTKRFLQNPYIHQKKQVVCQAKQKP